MRGPLLAVLAACSYGCSFEHGVVLSGTRSDAPEGGSDDSGGGGSDSGGGGGSDASGGGNDAMMSSLRQKTITITGPVTGTHTDFPLWLSLTDTDLSARARSDGSDIHFVAGTTKLDFEIQSWTKGTGRLQAWVRVPSLAMGTQIVMRYGDVTAAHAADAPRTFTGYQAVWHLDDALNNNTVADARNMRNGTAVALNASDSVAAKLGRGIDFQDGGDQITFTNPLTGGTSHTISAWISQRATTSNDAIIVLGNGAQNEARWFHSRYNAATVGVGFYGNDFPTQNVAVNVDIIGGGFVLLHWVFDANNSRTTTIYRDGAVVFGPQGHSGGIDTSGTAGVIGNAAAAFGQNMGLNATLDEVRIINVARSAAWIAAEAANQGNPSTFYSVSAEQMP